MVNDFINEIQRETYLKNNDIEDDCIVCYHKTNTSTYCTCKYHICYKCADKWFSSKAVINCLVCKNKLKINPKIE